MSDSELIMHLVAKSKAPDQIDQILEALRQVDGAFCLVMLTDTEGLYTSDPRLGDDAELLSAVRHTDEVLDELRKTRSGGLLGSGGVATKIAAARMAAFSGIPTVIASSKIDDAAIRAAAGEDVGTWIDPRTSRLTARKLWIAFGQPADGSLVIDDGARDALVAGGRSLLAVGVVEVEGDFAEGEAVEIVKLLIRPLHAAVAAAPTTSLHWTSRSNSSS